MSWPSAQPACSSAATSGTGLNGLDPAFALFRDDIDFGWRAQLAGHRVVVVPAARVADAQASSRGLRPVDAVRGVPRRVDRTHGLRVAMAGASAVAVPFLLIWFAVGGLLRALGLLIAKQPRRAYDELVSTWTAVLTPWRVIASRWRARGTREVPRRDIAQLLAPRRSAFRGFAESLSGSMGRDKVEVLDAAAPETGPAGEDAENVERVATRLTRRVLTNPGVLVVTLASAVTAALARPLIGHGTLAGGQLLSWNASPAQAWHSYVDAWHGSGLGTDGPAAPYRAVLAGLAWVLQPLTAQPTALAVDVVLIGAHPAVRAHRLRRRRHPPAQPLAPGLGGAHLGDPADGHGCAGVGTARRERACTSCCPWSSSVSPARCAARGRARPPSPVPSPWRSRASFVPLLLLVGAAAAAVALVLGGWARRARALLLLGVPALLLAAWVPSLWDDPRLLLAGPGLLTPSGGTATPLEVALLHPGGPGATYVVSERAPAPGRAGRAVPPGWLLAARVVRGRSPSPGSVWRCSCPGSRSPPGHRRRTRPG